MLNEPRHPHTPGNMSLSFIFRDRGATLRLGGWGGGGGTVSDSTLRGTRHPLLLPFYNYSFTRAGRKWVKLWVPFFFVFRVAFGPYPYLESPCAPFRPSDLDWLANPSSSVNCLDCFKNINEYDYLWRKVFRNSDPVFRFREKRV